jgi:hypothetical protein
MIGDSPLPLLQCNFNLDSESHEKAKQNESYYHALCYADCQLKYFHGLLLRSTMSHL